MYRKQLRQDRIKKRLRGLFCSAGQKIKAGNRSRKISRACHQKKAKLIQFLTKDLISPALFLLLWTVDYGLWTDSLSTTLLIFFSASASARLIAARLRLRHRRSFRRRGGPGNSFCRRRRRSSVFLRPESLGFGVNKFLVN